MTNEEINKKCCTILGMHWHEDMPSELRPDSHMLCKVCGTAFTGDHVINPNFCDDAGAVRLLREIKKQRWYVEFVIFLWDLKDVDMDTYDYIIAPGLLANKLIEWKEGKG